MRYLMLFHGSCGHTTVKEINEEVFLKFSAVSLDGEPANRSRVGRRTAMVYVSPFRFCVCQDCMFDIMNEDI